MQPAMPVVGYLSALSEAQDNLAPLRKGLIESGFIEGRKIIFEPRFANNDYGRLPELAADLVRRSRRHLYKRRGGTRACRQSFDQEHPDRFRGG
jgi:putative ABC transport system substrate-binding protein